MPEALREVWGMIKQIKDIHVLKVQLRRTNIGGDMAESISNCVLVALFVMERGSILFEELAPTKDALSGVGSELVGQVLVVRVDVQFSTKQHGAKLLESFNNT